jgi:hypothetical protein
MKERSILFNAPMIRALLDGRKTQTRERIYPAPQMIKEKRTAPWEGDPAALMQLLEQSGKRCPYGKPGDRLWVRETWRTDASLDAKTPSTFNAWPIKYEADGCVMQHGAFYGKTDGKTRASTHMPRWASRILLEIVSVRIERLTDISEADAIAEGVEPLNCPLAGIQPHWRNYQEQAGSNWEWSENGPIKSFQTLWQLLQGPCIWLTNPLVWVIEFKRVTV